MRATWLAVLITCCCANAALAQSRVIVRPFTGPGSSRARDAVVQSLSDQQSVVLIKDNEVRAAAAEVGADVSTTAGRLMVAKKLRVSAFIEGESRKRGRGFEVEISVFEGSSGALLESTTVSATQAKLPQKVRDQFVRDLGLVIAHAQAPGAEPEPAPQPTREVAQAPTEDAEPIPGAAPEAEAEPEDEPDDSAAELPALELDATVPLLMRAYRYTDALLDLPQHTLALTPALRLGARWYPGAHFTRGVAANIGLDLYGQMMWPVTADQKGSKDTFDTSSTAFGIALRFRVPISEHQLGFVAGYGKQKMAFDDAPSGTQPAVPDASYGFIRLGADAHLMLTDAITLKLAAAYLLVQSYGQLEDPMWYPHVSGGGLDGAIGLGYALSPLLELNAGFQITRFFMALHPELTDVGVQQQLRIAGGLVDQYMAILLGITLRF